MEILRFAFVCTFLLVGCASFEGVAESCNKVVCASIITKCLLTQSCNCQRTNSSCAMECMQCLGEKYSQQCCSCVNLCPQAIDTSNPLSRKSHVEDFDGVPELFAALATVQVREYDWNIYSFPVHLDTILSSSDLENGARYYEYLNFNDANLDEALNKVDDVATVNCTVIYLAECISWNKCRHSCRNIGASSYRWFHDGCCECVGSTCLNYGVNESRCRHCPEPLDDIDEDMDDFDDSMNPFNE